MMDSTRQTQEYVMTSTDYIQGLIDDKMRLGGGVVKIPPGEYVCGTIQLYSDITLILEAGAKIIASTRRKDYRKVGYCHNEMGDVESLFYALGRKNIRMTGDGEIYLRGKSFYHLDRPVIPMHIIDKITEEQKKECTREFTWRLNQPIFFDHCENVVIENIKIYDSPCWTITFSECSGIRIKDIVIDNELFLPNNDGLHFCASSDIIVSGCNIKAGDDCIAITSITNWDVPCLNIAITNCILKSCSKAIVIGYRQTMVRNVTLSNLVIKESNRAFCIMSSASGGLVENVDVSNCILDTKIAA